MIRIRVSTLIRTILRDVANAAAVDAAVLFGFEDATERLRNEISLERVRLGSAGGWVTGSDCESVDEFEDEEARECAAEVADAVKGLVEFSGIEQDEQDKTWTHVARRVI